ncbi:BrnT family toxin [Thiococcus pfennigii]|uniref:BrnT family toxin n=1 Tax=Thiococcus pfennigii TaxID=1057 RepID=UPI0019082F44|nr:BrnT family toxin [Thiococcus pfennigii]MBK1700565.1 hypothetical protein [Thiococcus pfennigii]
MIKEFLWPEDRIDHISRHGVSPDEFEEVCFDSSPVLRAKSEGPNPVYHVLGETRSRKRLLCIAIQFPDGKGYPITARPMTDRERRRYQQWKRK